MWTECTAVVVPGCPDTLAAQLLVDSRNAAKSRGLAEVLAALPSTPSIFIRDALYFGAVENMAGLERPYVIVAAMMHPEHAMYQITDEMWTTEQGRVSPRAYLGVTRCTFELTIVDIYCAENAFHHNISAAAGRPDGGIVRIVGNGLGDDFIITVGRAFVADGRIHLGVEVDLESPPPLAKLASAVSFKLKNPVTVERWKSSSFRWDQCTRGVCELSLQGSFQAPEKPPKKWPHIPQVCGNVLVDVGCGSWGNISTR